MRVKKNYKRIIDEISKKGVLKKDIAKKLGIAPRTLTSYYSYFSGNKPNKHSRKPKEEIFKKLDRLAAKKKVRTTLTLPDEIPILALIATYYEVELESGEKSKRNMLIDMDLKEFKKLKRAKKIKMFLNSRIKRQYKGISGTKVKVRVLNYVLKLEDSFN